MKIETIDADKVKLTINQKMLHFLGWLLILGSILAVCYLMKEYTITCREKQPNRAAQCTLDSSILNLYRTHTKLGDLEMATVLSQPSKKSTVYFVVLKTSEGLINMTGGSSSGRSDKDAASEGINSYITQSQETSFKVPYPTAWWYYAFVSIFPIIGLILLAVKSEVVVFNGPLHTVVITKKGLFGESEIKLLFSNIEKIIVDEVRGGKGSKSYRLGFVLKDKEKPVLLASSYVSQAKSEEIAQQLNGFINKYKTTL